MSHFNPWAAGGWLAEQQRRDEQAAAERRREADLVRTKAIWGDKDALESLGFYQGNKSKKSGWW